MDDAKEANVALTSIFAYSRDYCFEKIQGAISNWNSAQLGHSCIKEIAGAIQEFRNALARSGVLVSDSHWNVKNTIEEIEYPIAKLTKFLEVPGKSGLNPKDASIFLFFVEEKWKLLRAMATELDKEGGGRYFG